MSGKKNQRISSVAPKAGKETEEAQQKVADQAKALNTPGTPWYVASKGTAQEIQNLFPAGCLHSIQAHNQGFVTPSNRRKSNESSVKGEWKAAAAAATAADSTQPNNGAAPKAEISLQQDILLESFVEGEVRRQDSGIEAEELPTLGEEAAGEDCDKAEEQEEEEGLNVYQRGVVGENILHVCLLRNDEEGRKIAEYLIQTFGSTLVNTPYQERNGPHDKPGQFEGEVALHIAIVNEMVSTVKCLIKHGADLNARAFGDFFHQAGNCYYGEFPLSFAISTGNKEIAQIIWDHTVLKESVNQNCDKHGNFAIHLAVWHEQYAMYDFLVDQCHADQGLRNCQAQSPIELAAHLGRKDMFQYVAVKRSKIAWRYGPVTCRQLPLANIDTVQNTPEEGSVSAFNQIINQEHLNLIELKMITILLEMKWKRFARWYFHAGMFFYMYDLAVFTTLVIYTRYGPPEKGLTDTPILAPSIENFDLYVCKDPAVEHDPTQVREFRCQEGSNEWTYGTDRFDNKLGIFLELSNILCALYHIIMEIFNYYKMYKQSEQAQAYAKLHSKLKPKTPPPYPIPGMVVEVLTPRDKEGVDSPIPGSSIEIKTEDEKALRRIFVDFYVEAIEIFQAMTRGVHPMVFFLWMFGMFRIVHFFHWLGGQKLTHSWEMAIAAVFGWLYALQYARGFSRIGHLVVMIERMIMDDITAFSMVYVLCLLGFAEGFFLLVRYEYPDGTLFSLPGDYNTLGAAMVTLFRTTIGDLNFSLIRENVESYWVEILSIGFFITWCVLSNVILMNLLIALMGNTFERIHSNAEQEWLLQWANIILQIERQLSWSTKQKHRLGEKLADGMYYHVIEQVGKKEVPEEVKETISSNNHDLQKAENDLKPKKFADLAFKTLAGKKGPRKSVLSLNSKA